MYEFLYDYIKRKDQEKPSLFYMDKLISIVNIKNKDIYKGIVNDVEKQFSKSNYEIERP